MRSVPNWAGLSGPLPLGWKSNRSQTTCGFGQTASLPRRSKMKTGQTSSPTKNPSNQTSSNLACRDVVKRRRVKPKKFWAPLVKPHVSAENKKNTKGTPKGRSKDAKHAKGTTFLKFLFRPGEPQPSTLSPEPGCRPMSERWSASVQVSVLNGRWDFQQEMAMAGEEWVWLWPAFGGAGPNWQPSTPRPAIGTTKAPAQAASMMKRTPPD